MLMNFNSDIRFAAVCDQNGEILWNTKRNNVKNMVSLADTKKTLQRAVNAWEERAKIEGLVGYSSTDASIENDKGIDQYYSSTETPGYAHS